MKYYIFITLLICALIGAVFIYSPQQTTTSEPILNLFPHIKTIPEENQQKLYQYAAPWNSTIYENLFDHTQNPPKTLQTIKGSIIPHHILGGSLTASVFKFLEQQKPSTVVIIGPNHFNRGNNNIISTNQDWKTPFGITKANKETLYKLEEENIIHYDNLTMKEEHSIYSVISFLNKSLPQTKVIPIILKAETSQKELNTLTQQLIKYSPNDTVFISSIDFSHYQNNTTSNFHDEFSINVIKTFNFERIKQLEIDSPASLYVLMKIMEYYKTQHVAFEIHNNSSSVTHNYSSRESTSYYSPFFTYGEPISQQNAPISMLFFGDMMLDRSVAKHIAEFSSESIFAKLAGQENRFFMGPDIVHANLEGPFGNSRRPTSKSIAFNFDPQLIPTLKKYNFNIFNLANNHSYDMGKEAFEETKQNLSDYEINFYGEQYSIDQDALYIKQIGNKKIAFIGLNDTNRPFEITEVLPLIKQVQEKTDFIITNIHWGQEYQLHSHPRQQYIAHELIDAGVDVIIGHHPHVIQEIEIYKNKPIFYSLGNFVFDQYFSPDTQEGLSVGIIMYQDKISLYLFGLESEQSEINLMNFEKTKKLIERILPKEYTTNISHGIFQFTLTI